MKKPDTAEFLQEVLNRVEALPDGVAQQLLDLVNSSPAQRKERIRALFSEITGG